MRLSGPFVSVATLGFLVIVTVVLVNADGFTRGSRTFSGVKPYTDMWWTWLAAVVTVAVVWRIKRSAYGREMLTQRGDRWAALGTGIPVLRPRLIAFVVSAFLTAIAGSLYAHFLVSFSPKVFDFGVTFTVVTMLVVGGMGSVTGSVLGTFVVFALTEVLRDFAGRTLLYGLDGILLNEAGRRTHAELLGARVVEDLRRGEGVVDPLARPRLRGGRGPCLGLHRRCVGRRCLVRRTGQLRLAQFIAGIGLVPQREVAEAAGGAEQEQHGRPELEFLAGNRRHAQTTRTTAREVAVRRLMRRGWRAEFRHRRPGRA